jgi:hypothetical protein
MRCRDIYRYNHGSFFFFLVCEATGTAATSGLLCQSRVIVKMIVEKQMECRLARKTEVLGENLPQRNFCPSQNPTWPDPGLNPGRRGEKQATNRLSYGSALQAYILHLPITVAAQSKVWTVFVRLDAGIVGSNQTQGMDICVRLFCVFLCVGSDGLIPHPRSFPDCVQIKKLKKRPRFNEGL